MTVRDGVITVPLRTSEACVTGTASDQAPEGAGVSPFCGAPNGAGVSPFGGAPRGAGVSPFVAPFARLCGIGTSPLSDGAPEGAGVSPFDLIGHISASYPDGALTLSLINVPSIDLAPCVDRGR